MSTTVKLVDSNNQEVSLSAFALVREISVSTEHKETSYGTGVSAFVSHKAVVPDGFYVASQDELNALTRELSSIVASECDRLFSERLLVVSAQIAERAPMSEPVSPPAAPAPVSNKPPVGEGRQLKYAPKAEDRRPGDTWDTVVTEYELTSRELALWSPVDSDNSDLVHADRQYAEAIMPHWKDKGKTKPHPLWPDKWLPKMINDGSRQPFGKRVVVRQTVGDRTYTNDRGTFYYVNITGLDVVK